MYLPGAKNVVILFYCYYITLCKILVSFFFFHFAWHCSSFSCVSISSLKILHFLVNRDVLDLYLSPYPIQGKEQWLYFAGTAMKRYPTSKVRETQVRQ